MARSDITNRNRDSIHKNFLFENVHALMTGNPYEDLRDTFIFNQSWWLKDRVHNYQEGGPPQLLGPRDCQLHFKFMRKSGMTSGHSHMLPEGRAELVLGLMNKHRGPHTIEFQHGCPPGNLGFMEKQELSCYSEELKQHHIWDPRLFYEVNGDYDGDMGTNPNDEWPDDCLKPNWMHNQPPAFERTPFRPIFCLDFRTPTDPAVPAGGFVQQAKLVLTVSQQSIAWPRGGFTAEFWKALDGADKSCDWWRPSVNRDSEGNEETIQPYELGYDIKGNTLGAWSSVANPDDASGLSRTITYLPNPLHPSLFPNLPGKTQFTWRRTNGSGPGGLSIDPMTLAPCPYSWWELPSYAMLPIITHEFAFDGSGSTNPKTCRTVAIPSDWTGNSTNSHPLDILNNTNSSSGRHLDAWIFLTRAKETAGLTGCGGSVDISRYGFELQTGDISSGNFLSPTTWINYDGSSDTSSIEWRKIKPKNAKYIHIPKFTNQGFSAGQGGSEVRPVFDYNQYGAATGPTGAADGRGVTFEVDIGWWTRKAIAENDQKLNILFKGEFNPASDFKSRKSKVETAFAWLNTPQPNRHLHTSARWEHSPFCSSYYDPGSATNPPSWNLGTDGNTGAVQNLDPAFELSPIGQYPATWSVDAGQIATNFYSVESPAPTSDVLLLTKSKGSTLDVEAGNMNFRFKLHQSGPNPNDYSWDEVEIFYNINDDVGLYAKERLERFFRTLTKDDILTFDKETLVDFGSGIGEHKIGRGNNYRIDPAKPVVFTQNNNNGTCTFGVTGDNKLFRSIPQQPSGSAIEVADIPERMIGKHYIDLDNEHWICNGMPLGVASRFPVFSYQNGQPEIPTPRELYPYLTVEETAPDGGGAADADFALVPHPEGGYFPDGLERGPALANVNAIPKGGGDVPGSFIKLIGVLPGQLNEGSYSVEEVWYKDTINEINYECMRVREPLSLEGEYGNEVFYTMQRVDHHPRVEILYRTKKQYDKP